MSHDPFDELPDQLKEAIREMMKKLQEINPEELEKMMNQVFGPEFMEKLQDLSFEGNSFTFPFDPNLAKNFEGMMRDFMSNSQSPYSQQFNEVKEEEPYYEITPPADGDGQIIVEMPGITDVRQVKWENKDNKLEVSAEVDDVKYFVKIPLSSKYKLKDAFAAVKNSVFILPYRL